MPLQSTPVSKSLDRKLTVWGFEIPDLFLMFILLSFLNFVFSGHPWKLALAWGPSAVLAVALRYFKKGKPDKYLEHTLKSLAAPKYLSAFKSPRSPLGPEKRKPLRVTKFSRHRKKETT